MTVSDYNYPFSARTEENVEPLILQALQDSDVMAAVGAVQQNWRNSGNESLIAATRANSIVSGTGAVLKPDVASGQADASIPVGGYFSVYNNVTLKVDIYQKGASTATLVYTQSTDAQTSLNTNALATINEVVTQLPITVTPPAATDPYQEVWTTITNPEIRWTKSIVSGALQVLQNYLGVICYGIQHKTSVLTANLVIEAEFGASGVSVNTGYCLSFNDTTTFDASHGRLLQLRQTGAMLAVWGTGAGTTTGITVTGVPSLPYNAGDIVSPRHRYDASRLILSPLTRHGGARSTSMALALTKALRPTHSSPSKAQCVTSVTILGAVPSSHSKVGSIASQSSQHCAVGES
jgi:hypothetical protein